MIYTHPSCLLHFAGPGHPESPDRLRAVLDALDADEFAHVPRREAPLATRTQLLRAHDSALVDALFEQAPTEGYLRIDADTVMSPASLEAALRAAGAVCAAVVATLAGEAPTAFCAVRPPGHHATHDTAMGFCLFNSVAVAAHEALSRGVARIAIVEFDVHHGNGTQDIFLRDPRVMYVSSHQAPLYPGTGAPEEHGVGNVLNATLP
ncbi:MAG TPA: histone deacetylase family protein, partial [Xanthomonadales bacterium]|nr:histone deacetylase family protein [Xanthomonadales bacterium]